MLFISIFETMPGTSELRTKTKLAHDDYWEPRLGCLKFAGPMLTDDGSTRLGQVLVLDVPDRKSAETIINDDPFMKVGLFTGYSLRRFNLSVVSGKLA
jgi:uncharacterized protein